MNIVIEETGEYRLVTRNRETQDVIRARFEINQPAEAKTAKALIVAEFGHEVWLEDRNGNRVEIGS
jgi:hypothetical protein